MDASLESGRTMRIDIQPRPGGRDGGDVVADCAVKLAERRDLLHSRNRLYDRLLASIYDAVLITGLSGVVLDYNERAMEFLQYAPNKLLGRNVIDFISGAGRALLDEVGHNLEEYKYTIVEAYCRRADGTTFPAEIAITVLKHDEDARLGFFIRDITLRVKTRHELENAVERLEALSRARLEFVSNVSHELRTPLTSMIYAVRNMQRGVAGPLPAKALQYLDRLHADCRRLQGTVSDILDLQQIENNKLTLTKSQVPFSRLVEIGVDSLRVQSEEKHVRIIFCRPSEMSFVDCDVNKIERVVLNIVGNAVKFTPEDGIISVELETDAATGEVRLRVSDTGVGIPPEAIDRITVRYFKVGSQPIGSGLGLAISRELVELHGGRLKIESPVPGRETGTRVEVVLPLAEPPSLLLATADGELGQRVAEVCSGLGVPMRLFGSAAELLGGYGESLPGAFIIDADLPDSGGMDVVLQLRNDRAAMRLPVIFVSGHEVSRAHNEMLMAFKIPLLSLPFQAQELVSLLNQVFYDYPLGADQLRGAGGVGRMN